MLEASEARHAYGALDTEHLKWKKSKSAESKEGREGAASASDPALCARVDKLVSEQSLLVNEVASLRSGITQIEMLLRQGLPSAGAAAPVAPLLGRPALVHIPADRHRLYRTVSFQYSSHKYRRRTLHMAHKVRPTVWPHEGVSY